MQVECVCGIRSGLIGGKGNGMCQSCHPFPSPVSPCSIDAASKGVFCIDAPGLLSPKLLDAFERRRFTPRIQVFWYVMLRR